MIPPANNPPHMQEGDGVVPQTEIGHAVNVGDSTKIGSDEIAEEKNRELKSSLEHLRKRNIQYTDLLKTFVDQYIEKSDNNKKLKKKFFNFVHIASWIILGTFLALVIYAVKCPTYTIPVLITAIAGMITSIISIPLVIARYLFNPEEDRLIANVVAKMHRQDNDNRKQINDNGKQISESEIKLLKEEYEKLKK